MEVRLGQRQQENGLNHGWVAGLEDGQQEGRSLSLQDTRETVWYKLPRVWGYIIPAVEATRKGLDTKDLGCERFVFVALHNAIPANLC